MPLNQHGVHPSDESGAFDLPSVITGVVVVGVLTAGVLASVFGVIPFAQDNGAKQDLAAVRTAQGVHKATKNGFTDKDGLRGAKLLNDLPEQMLITATGDGAGFCASTVSPTGRTFILTSEMGQPEESTTGGCDGAAAGGAMVDRVNFAAAPAWSSGYKGPGGKAYFGSLASSADGTRLIAGQGLDSSLFGVPGSAVFLSSDSGTTWTKAAGGLPSTGIFESAASSADGKVLYVAEGHPTTSGGGDGHGHIWRSDDFGATWTAITTAGLNGLGTWDGLETSADGKTVVAIEGNTEAGYRRGLWISRDAGLTWSHRDTTSPGVKWLDVSVSNDGQTIVSAPLTPNGTWGWSTDSGMPEISTDGGVTWTYVSADGGKNQGWSEVSVSGNGKTMIVSDYTGARFARSTDAGKTWAPIVMPALGYWSNVGDIALSEDGTKAILGKSTGDIWISTDSGSTWTKQDVKSDYWDNVTIASDGSSFAAASMNQYGMITVGKFPAK